MPLRYESTQVHFSTYENYDSIPTELLSVLLDLDADDAELESEFWMTASGLLAPNSRTRSRLARKVQSEEEGSDTEPLRGTRSHSPDVVDQINAREDGRRAAPFVAQINERAEQFSRARETRAAFQDCESIDGTPSDADGASEEDDEDDDEGNRPDDSADTPTPTSPLHDFPPTCEQYLERQRYFRRRMQRKADEMSEASADDIDRQWMPWITTTQQCRNRPSVRTATLLSERLVSQLSNFGMGNGV